MERDLELGKKIQKRKLTAKQMLLPCGDVMNWDSPMAKTQTNFSRLTMCDIPVFTTIIYSLHIYSAYGT